MGIADNPERANCEDIASQLVNFESNLEKRFTGVDVDGIDVVMGGGRRHFLPKDAAAGSTDAVSTIEGDRTDGRNLVTEWTTKYPDGVYVMDQAGFDATNDEDTLIIVTADHSHVFTIAGYPKRGNPILGKVVGIGANEPSLANDGMPYTTVGYTNGLGYRDLGEETDADAAYNDAPVTGRVDLTNVNTQKPGFHQESLVPLSSETHAGEDVGVYAIGPGAQLVTGTNEQSLIFHIMEFAGDLVN